MDGEEDESPAGRTGRRRGLVIAVALAAVLLVAILGGGVWAVAAEQPDFAYGGPRTPVPPGGTAKVHDPGGGCGPLIVSLHREGRFGLWSQTHSGDVFGGFTRDERAWWSLGGTYATPVPCGMGGATTFDLPDDVGPGVIAACDTGGRCARIPVAG